MTKYLLLPLLIFSALSLSAQMKSSKALSTQLKDNKFSAQLTEGYHFNDKAPNLIQWQTEKIKPHLLEKRKIEFNLPSAPIESAQAMVYVCDDAITFCETHKVPLGSSASVTPVAAEPKIGPKTNNAHGFLGNYQQALKIAKEKNQLLLLDFSAQWCPGCVRYEKEIFPLNEFGQLTKDFVRVKVDVDEFVNFPVSEKYNIKGIPTLVLINADEQEINRLVDFYEMPKLKSFIEETKSNATPLEVLMKKNDPALNLQIGQRLYAAGRNKESLSYLEKIEPRSKEYWMAKIEVAESESEANKDEYKKVLQEAIQSEPQSSRSLIWRADLLKLLAKNSTDAKIVLEEGTRLADELLKNERTLSKAVETDSLGEFIGYEKLVIAMYKADLIEAAGKDPSSVYEQAADLGSAYKIPVTKSGPALRYLIILSAAKRWVAAEKQAKAILKNDKNNLDVQRRKIKILNNLNKFSEASQLGESILDKMQGRNQFLTAEVLSKAYIGQKKNDEAKKILTAYLARPEMQEKKMQSYKKNFEEILKSIQ